MNLYQPVEIRTGKGFFRFYFHHFYSSSQVERFRPIAKKGARSIVLEKQLFNFRQPWKIVEGEVKTSNPRDAAMTMLFITKRIEIYLQNHYKLRRQEERSAGTGHVVYFDLENGRA